MKHLLRMFVLGTLLMPAYANAFLNPDCAKLSGDPAVDAAYHSQCTEEDKACQQQVADRVDAAAAKLSDHDKAIVAKIKAALASPDFPEINLISVRLLGRSDGWNFEDADAHATWHAIVFIAGQYHRRQVCLDRSVWFVMYIGLTCSEGPQIHAIHVRKTAQAQDYLLARYPRALPPCSSAETIDL